MEEPVCSKDSSQTKDVRKVPHRSETKRYSEIFRDFDNLDLSFIPSEEEDTQEDSDVQSISESFCAESVDISMQNDEAIQTETINLDGVQTAQEADSALCRCENGVETALQYAKMWCRYAKELLTWMEKRISFEQEFAKNVIKTAEGAKANVWQQEMMPLQYIYTMALEQDIKNSVTARKTAELLQNRCYQALAAKRNEIDKWRREFKEQWTKEQKRMNDAVTALKKAKQQYYQRCEELEKAKIISAKPVEDVGTKTLDKRRKSKDEAQAKVLESELLYKQCVSDAKIHQDGLVKVKERIISHMRKLICQGDTVLKEATVNMFFYQRQQTEPVPLGYHNLEMTCRSMEPGEPYLLYILSRRRPEQFLQNFIFQEYTSHGKRNKRKTSGPSSVPDVEDDSYRRSSDTRKPGHSDNESIGGSLESLSSPAHRALPKTASTITVSSDDLDDRDVGSEPEFLESQCVKARMFSRAAMSHRLKKMKSKMIKCRHCDNYIVVSGVECEECGLALHRKCMEMCLLECERKKGTVFGVDLSLLSRDLPQEVPFIVMQCTSEIERRALSVQGVYRVSGSKPRVQKLCQAYETQKEEVDLSDVSPHDITSILKHFFKELPEPLLTFELYNDFIAVGKVIQNRCERENTGDSEEMTDIIQDIQKLLQRLPSHSHSTLQHILLHLQKVSENPENKMSPGNLGIVFGPTLLRPLLSTDMSMIAILETSYQSILIEFFITHYDKIFGTKRTLSTPPPPAPTAPLPDTPPRAPCLLNEGNDEDLEPVVSTRQRPRSIEKRTIKRDSSEGYISDKSSSNEAVDQLGPEANERAVLAMKGASNNLPGGSVEKPLSDLTIQSRHRFTRQPVKYLRHHSTGLRISNLGRAQTELSASPRGYQGSADSSRSSSPEAGARKLPQNCESNCQGHQVTTPAEMNVDGPLSPREVVQYMLGLDPAFPPPRSATSSNTIPKSGLEGRETCPNKNTNNTRESTAGQNRILSPNNIHLEQNLTFPSQKILSGLRLRRSSSGKDEQLFV